MTEKPKCTCGSTQAGLIFIPADDEYQCGICIRKAYAKLHRVQDAITEVATLGANPATVHGCNSRKDFMLHVDKMWQVALHAMKAETEETELDEIFDKIDDWLLEGCFDKCSEFLTFATIDDFTTAQLLTILTTTLPAHTKLPARAGFFARVKLTLQKRKEEELNDLLSGLEGR